MFSSDTWWRELTNFFIAIGHLIDYLCIAFAGSVFMRLLDFRHLKGFLRHKSASISFHVTPESMSWLSVVNRRLYPSTCVIVLYINFWCSCCISIFSETIQLAKPRGNTPFLPIPVDRQQTGTLWKITNSKFRKWMSVNLLFGLCFSVLFDFLSCRL